MVERYKFFFQKCVVYHCRNTLGVSEKCSNVEQQSIKKTLEFRFFWNLLLFRDRWVEDTFLDFINMHLDVWAVANLQCTHATQYKKSLGQIKVTWVTMNSNNSKSMGIGSKIVLILPHGHMLDWWHHSSCWNSWSTRMLIFGKKMFFSVTSPGQLEFLIFFSIYMNFDSFLRKTDLAFLHLKLTNNLQFIFSFFTE